MCVERPVRPVFPDYLFVSCDYGQLKLTIQRLFVYFSVMKTTIYFYQFPYYSPIIHHLHLFFLSLSFCYYLNIPRENFTTIIVKRIFLLLSQTLTFLGYVIYVISFSFFWYLDGYSHGWAAWKTKLWMNVRNAESLKTYDYWYSHDKRENEILIRSGRM